MRIAVIADIHANLDAFQSVVADWGDVDEVWCLGDVIGYGPEPNECMDLLTSFPRVLCVPGNHDHAAIGRIDPETFNAVARAAIRWTSEQLEREYVDYLQNLELTLVRDEMTITHGSPRNPIWEYLLTPSQARANFEHFGTACCLVGHTHVASVFTDDEENPARPGMPGDVIIVGTPRMIINPGSVGQPRDEDPRAAYAIYDCSSGRFEFRRVTYPIATTQEKMRRAHLPEPLIARLAGGW